MSKSSPVQRTNSNKSRPRSTALHGASDSPPRSKPDRNSLIKAQSALPSSEDKSDWNRPKSMKDLKDKSTSMPVLPIFMLASESEYSSEDESSRENSNSSFDRGSVRGITSPKLEKRKSGLRWITNKIGISKDSPRNYVSRLSKLDVPDKVLVNLKESIIKGNNKWITRFYNEGGITALMVLLGENITVSRGASLENTSALEVGRRLEALQCVQALLQRDSKALKNFFISAPEEYPFIQTITLNLLFKELQELVIQILCMIAQSSELLSHILEALENYQKLRELSSPFEELVSFLSQEKNPENIVNCLSLINLILGNIDNSEEKYQAYQGILSIGFLPLTLALRKIKEKKIQTELDHFEESMAENHEEVKLFDKGTDHRERKFTNPASENLLRILISLETETTTTLFPYDETTTVGQVVEDIKSKYREAFVDYALIFAFTVVMKEDKKLMDDYNIQGEETLEFKMNPWRMVFIDPTSKTEVTINLDPDDRVADAIAQLMKKFDSSVENEDYGIYAADKNNPEKGEWLEDTNKIQMYKNLKEKSNFIFKTKPKLIIIKYEDPAVRGSWYSKYLRVDTEKTVDEVIKLIAEKISLDSNQIIEYGLQMDGAWLDGSKKMNSFRLKDETEIGFAVRPYPVEIEFFDGTLQVFHVPWNVKVSEILSLVCTSRNLEPKSHLFQVIDKEKVYTLFPWRTLRDSEVPQIRRLLLKKKDDLEAIPLDNVNIWEPEPSHPKTEIEAFSLNELVRQLTFSDDYDVRFVKCFLCTYQSFTTPEILMNKLIERFRVPAEVPEDKKILIQMRICTVLKYWVELYFGDLGNVLDTMVTFIEEEMVKVKELDGILERVKKAISTRKTTDGRKYHFLINPPNSILPKNILEPLTLFHLDPLEVARQWTLPVFEIYNNIRMTELFGGAWAHAKTQHQSPNVLKMIEIFNLAGNQVATSIILEKNFKNRVKLLTKYIVIAQKLKEIQNFHLLVAVISGINNSAILRLKWTHSHLSTKTKQTLQQLEQLCSMEASFKNLREAIDNAVPPCIPYLGTYLMDLTFIEDGNPDFVEGNLINFEKRKLQYRILAKIDQYQRVGYNFKKVEVIEQFLNNLPHLTEIELYKKSFELEPRNLTKPPI